MTDYNKQKINLAYTAIFIAILLSGVLAYAFSQILNNKQNDNLDKSFTVLNSSFKNSSISQITSSTSLHPTQNNLKTGTFSEKESYFVKGHTVDTTITIKLENGGIVDLNVESEDADVESKKYIAHFLNEAQSSLIGKNLKDVETYTVSGASLTSKAFTNAIKNIQEK